MKTGSVTHATDDHLVAEMPRLAQNERASAADFVDGLAEFDARKLYLGLGFASIYSYCAARLHLTDGAAYRRIETARVSKRFPLVLEMLRDARLSLGTAALIGPKLTPANAEELLEEAAFKSKREIELILAKRNPRPAVPSVVRKLPERPAVSLSVKSEEPAMSLADLVPPMAPSPAFRRPIVAPLSEAHYKLQVTISAAARDGCSRFRI